MLMNRKAYSLIKLLDIDTRLHALTVYNDKGVNALYLEHFTVIQPGKGRRVLLPPNYFETMLV